MTEETWVTMWWNMGRVESSWGKRALFVWEQHETPPDYTCSQSKIEGGVMWKPASKQASKRNARQAKLICPTGFTVAFSQAIPK